jgi:agmatine deiminase
MPAEWERHHATFLAWPHKRGDWPGKPDSIPLVFAEMARVLTEDERVIVLVKNAAEERLGRAVFGRAGVALSQIDFVRQDTDRSWTRDYLPSYVVKDHGKKREVSAVKWRFDGWNRYPDHKKDDAAGIAMAERYGTRQWLPEVVIRGKTRRLTLEGGSIDVDGEGTVLTTEECLLTSKRARHAAIGRAGSEHFLAEHLGVKKVIWLNDGISGDDTSGHVDDFARFVRPATVVTCREFRRTDPNYKRLEQTIERLRGERDAKGRKLHVVALPMPAPVLYGGVRLPASYANFYIGNAAVIVPTFNDENDRVALGMLAELFPERRVIGIYARDLVLGLGTLHCSTQQLPAGCQVGPSRRRPSRG